MHILRPIVKNIKKSSCYSTMADETTNIINKEFMICIRWVDNDLNANKDFIGLHELSVTNAETLACCITIMTRPRTSSRTML